MGLPDRIRREAEMTWLISIALAGQGSRGQVPAGICAQGIRFEAGAVPLEATIAVARGFRAAEAAADLPYRTKILCGSKALPALEVGVGRSTRSENHLECRSR